MRTSINFKGVDSSSFDLNITYLDRRQRAEEIIDRYQIPYSNSDYVIHTGKFLPYERVMRGVLKDLSQKDAINSWLRGKGILETSIDDGFFKANVMSSIRWDKIAPNKEQFEVIFIMNPPFEYLQEGSGAILLPTSSTVNNIGTADAYPLIDITGTGNITVNVNGNIFTITGLNGTISIDSELLEVYEGTVNSSKMSGKFPVLKPGNNSISRSGGTVTQFRMIPRWCNL